MATCIGLFMLVGIVGRKTAFFRSTPPNQLRANGLSRRDDAIIEAVTSRVLA